MHPCPPDAFGEDQIKLLRAKLKAKIAQKLKDAKVGAKKAAAGAINSMAAGATPEEVTPLLLLPEDLPHQSHRSHLARRLAPPSTR